MKRSTKVSRTLSTSTLTTRTSLDSEEPSIEAFGQYEKITTRLNRLLDQYTDGFAVLKELVQNADDAGATEVKFLYDERTNEDAMTYLLDEGMKECQGPALWVYNDAEFKDKDFENIEKLSGATKEHDTEKIGKFGLGFNAVYNLTDVPMFLSRNYFVVFDPHMSHLRKRILNPAKPGVKIDLNKNPGALNRRYRGQFKPFNGIFGCDLRLHKEDNSFHGTLFRFPLRTREQAERSEIKKLYYNDHEMRQLLKMFVEGAKSLLIFTQNVFRVCIYNLPNVLPVNPPLLLFQVTKSLSQVGIQKELSLSVTLPATTEKLSTEEQRLLRQSNFLQVASRVTKNVRDGNADASNFPQSSITVNIECNFTKSASEFFRGGFRSGHEKATWLVVSSMGKGEAMRFIMEHNDTTLVPSAGVAVQLVPNYFNRVVPSPVVKNVDGVDVNGTVFCYLPLPIHSGLPVHINGAFAVAADRRHLQQKLEDDKSCYGVKWNEVLMQDSVCSALLTLLEDLKSLVPLGGSYKFHFLWPTISNVQHNCRPLMKSFYEQVARGGYSLFSDEQQWADINEIVFLDPEFRTESEIGEASLKVLQLCHRSGGSKVVIDLSFDILMSFEKSDLKKEINARKYNKIAFFRECFFPNIFTLPDNLRDQLMLHALDNDRDFNTLIKTYACIPVSPSGKTLKCPSQLVNPGREAAGLFSPGEERFPFGNEESYCNPQRLTTLEKLGMFSDDLPWSEVAERAESIHRLNTADSNAAMKRVKALLTFMEKKIKRENMKLKMKKIKTSGQQIPSVICQRLLKAKFLPILKKPASFPLPWKGDAFQGNSQVFVAPEEVFLKEEKYKVCCTEPLAGVDIPTNVIECLKLNRKDVTLYHVIHQLQAATSKTVNSLNSAQYEELSRVCTEAYAGLKKVVEVYGAKHMECLRGMSFILVGNRFLSAGQVAFELTVDCSPFLYKLPQRLAVAFPLVMKAAGVKNTFDENDYILSLQQVKKKFGESKLDEKNLQVAVHLAVQLGKAMKTSAVSPSDVQEKWGTVYLPDSKGVMRPVSDLCIRNCPWMPDDASVKYANEGIDWPTCLQIGVKTRREEALQHHAIGIPCGQKEKLTNRLRRILTEYPCEKEILKELLQNADDAQATEICFIKDPRYHPKQRVFEDSWQPLQGPALCVYNNKPFTKVDIEGIQNLGEGSKGGDPNKTGQYGVGFNAVYHLTDAPSFISKGGDVGEVLLVFDPDCRYAPGASPEAPGRMFKVSTKLQTDFPDVFPCYLGGFEHFSGDNATMFRFPLRTKQMAHESNISSSPVSLEKLDMMLEELKNELFEVLLYVNNVKKITLCEVNAASGKLVNDYTVEAAMSKEDEIKRKEFADYITQVGKLVKKGELLPTKIPIAKVSYVLNITDNFGNEEKWLIVQQIGFEKAVKKSIVDAFKRQQLGMLPRGGVACLLEKNNSKCSVPKRKKAFCFLPLPIQTNLPVHVNGHFALDHESRRNLWRDEAGHVGYRSDWNNALLADVVTSCYIKMLNEVRNFLKLPTIQGSSTCTENEVLQRIDMFEDFFPREPATDQYWKTLVDSVYQEINTKELEILPVVRNRDYRNTSVVDVTWLPPTGSGRQQAFFNNLDTIGPFANSSLKDNDENRIRLRKMFEVILLKSGFNLVAFSLALHESFQRSGVATCSIDRTSVINFYKTYSSQDPLCTIGPIPCDVTETVFKSGFGVILVLLYCKGTGNFLQKLPDLPLLLTQDNCLQLFSCSHPKYLSPYRDLLPGSRHIFLQEEVYRSIFSDVATLRSPVLKPLDAITFADNLPQTLPRELYGKDVFVKWSPALKAPPNQRWIFRVWDFLHELVRDILCNADMNEECKRFQIEAALGPLFHWSILPATTTKSVHRRASPSLRSAPQPEQQVEHFLVPLKQATAVLDLQNLDATSLKLAGVLRKLGLPELNLAVLSSSSSRTPVYSPSNSVSLARMLVSSLKVPASLLASLAQKMTLDPKSATERLEPSECKAILEYFSRSVSCLRDADKRSLRKLPFYLATNGDFIRLDNDRVCVLPIGIPRKEIDVLERTLNVVFVKSWPTLSELFKFLALECVSAVDVYCTFILPSLSILSEEARESHLEHVRKSILGDSSTEDEDIQTLLECLRKTPLVPSRDGILQTASCFYDPDIDVFRIMLSDNNFPSEPYNSPEWITFLREAGLVCKVSMDDFVRFAMEVELEASTERTKSTYAKSEVLVRHLISRPDVVSEGLLRAVRDISFLAADPVTESLQVLCSPFRETEDDHIPFIPFSGAVSTDYEEVVWTQADLLPRWADPRLRRYELGRPPRVSIDKYCDRFLSQLQIVTKPSVDLVVRHCEVICRHLENRHKGGFYLSAHRVEIMNVMEHIYRFLQENAMANKEAKIVLEGTPCILVENGTKFTKPSQAVLELYEQEEIKPFLYRVPPEFGKFQTLFQNLGCCKSVKCTHYAMVLDMLRKTCHDAKLHPNELIMCSKAVNGFFERLQEDSEDASTLSKLYLPAMRSGMPCLESNLNTIPVTLHKSSELVFNDVPVYGDRIQEFNQYFVLDLKLMDVRFKLAMTNFKELMMKLPPCLQPKMLSFMVQEKLTEGILVTSLAVDALMQRLTSPQFCRGVTRIIRHANSQKRDFDEEVIADVERGLKRIQLYAVDSLKTALLYEDDFIPGSEIEVKSFQEKPEVSGEEICSVYINVVNGINDTDVARSLVSDVIVDMYGDLLGKNAYLIPNMLHCALSDIWSLLDRMRIRQDDTYNVEDMDIYPEPGTFIPVEDHHLLNDAFVEFEPGEYVGYQLHDPSLHLNGGVATFIYAVIIEEVMDEDDIRIDGFVPDLVTKVYSINIGHEKKPVEVTATKLYKFHRFQEISDEKKECPKRRKKEDREAVFCQISTILKNAWEFDVPEDERTQIVKRLILRWRPEKNLGDEEFCLEVSKHISYQLSRLGGSYDEFIDTWVELAREHGSRREIYRERVSRLYASEGHSSGRRPWRNVPPSFSRSNPQPEEAKRWFRQAEADLAAGANEIYSRQPSYEWACFKCHQVS